ncbi:MAG: hypothetical protein JJT94_14375 [Bernardetiaceae bacterium]|nr:hypothetical protein [Bernardetiaceae bacterium]
MSITEKRELLIKEIQNLPEEVLDKILASIIAAQGESEEEEDNDFEKHLKETTIQYKKVWEALS